MRVLHVVGARPQFVKAAVLRRELLRQNSDVDDRLLHTGQHYDAGMSDVFFAELGISAPDYQLHQGGSSHGAMTGRMLEEIEQVLMADRPDWVVVYGDTNSTLAGALAAVKLHVPVAHVEAGLRSFNKKMPEEINRILVDQCSELLFTPTPLATEQLKHEGVAVERIVECGDIMYDAALYMADKANKAELDTPERYVLATIHRAENTDDTERMKEIIHQLCLLAETVPVVFPVHPRTRKVLENEGLWDRANKALHLLDPVGYLEMIQLEKGAEAVVTDSGGVQKEAFFFHKPCLIVRPETEWCELIDQGFHRLFNPMNDDLVSAYGHLTSEPHNWDVALYGQGSAGAAMARALLRGGMSGRS